MSRRRPKQHPRREYKKRTGSTVSKTTVNKGVKYKDFVKPRAMKPQIGDGGFPNKYWVSYHNDFYICKDGQCDWASDTKKFKTTGTTIKKPFNTFKEAMDHIERNVFINYEPKQEGVNSISIEDRISGQVWEQSIYAYKEKTDFFEGYKFDVETNTDTKFTQEKMEERGEEFI